MGSHSSAKIPVVDFSKENLNPGSSSWSATCKDVLLALEEFGCFIAVYDKVPSELQNKLFSALEELFNLPTETKMQNAHNKPYHGYVGQHSRLPLHESIGIDDATTLEGMQSFANLMWPAGNDHFWYNLIYFFIITNQYSFNMRIFSPLNLSIFFLWLFVP